MKLHFFSACVLLSVALSGCGSDGVDVMMESSANYASAPMPSVRVSLHPPKGKYVEVALLSLNANADDTPAMIGEKLQHRASALGANYVWIIGGVERTYLAPAIENTFSSGNAYGTAQSTYDGYGNVTTAGTGTAYGDSTTAYTPAHTYQRPLITAKALRLISGSSEPDPSVKSPLIPDSAQ